MWRDLDSRGISLVKTIQRRDNLPPSLVVLHDGKVFQYDAKPTQLRVADSDAIVKSYLPQSLARQRDDLARARKNSPLLVPNTLCRFCILEALATAKPGETVTAGSVWQQVVELGKVKSRAQVRTYRKQFSLAWHGISWLLPSK